MQTISLEMAPAAAAAPAAGAARHAAEAIDGAPKVGSLSNLAELARTLANADFAAVSWFEAQRPGCVVARPDREMPPPSGEALVELTTALLERDGDAVLARGNLAQDARVAERAPKSAAESIGIGIGFFAVVPLRDKGGVTLGALSVGSAEAVSDAEAVARAEELPALAGLAMSLMEAIEDTNALTSAAADGHAGTGQDGSPGPQLSIHEVIDKGAVTTLFQPVVHLESGAVVGFEALSRGPEESALEAPGAMIDAAREVGRLGELDWLCRGHAMREAAAARLPASVSWFINVEPAGLRSPCPDHLRVAVDRHRAQLRVVLEVPEREVEVHVADLLVATDEARRDSWGVALDDVGAEEGSLALLPLLQPDVVKLDMSLVKEVPIGPSVEVVGAVHAYAERSGAVILAEGIETVEQERLALALGATYGQGYLYGHPGSLPEELPVPRHPVPLRQRPLSCSEQTPFDIAAGHTRPNRSWAKHLMPFLTHMLDHCGRATEAAVLLTLFNDEQHFRDRVEAYEQLARGNAFTVCLVPGSETRRDEPRFHVAAPPAGSPLSAEWGVIVLTPHFTAALLLRDVPTTSAEPPQVDYIMTHDRPTVVAVARAFVHHMNSDRVRYAAEFEPPVQNDPELAAAAPQPSSTLRRLIGRGRSGAEA